MAGEKLHKFWVALSDQAVTVMRDKLEKLDHRPPNWTDKAEGTRREQVRAWEKLDLPGWVAWELTSLASSRQDWEDRDGLPDNVRKQKCRLLEHVWAGVHGDATPRPLTAAEAGWLADALDEPPPRLARLAVWDPHPPLYHRHVNCLEEVCDALGQEAGLRWARESNRLADVLTDSGLWAEGRTGRGKKDGLARLSLADGWRAVGEWVDLAGQLHRQMTLTAAPGKSKRAKKSETERIAEVVEELRQVIRNTENGRRAKPKTLVGRVERSPSIVRKALRQLEELGKYDGFTRRRGNS